MTASQTELRQNTRKILPDNPLGIPFNLIRVHPTKPATHFATRSESSGTCRIDMDHWYGSTSGPTTAQHRFDTLSSLQGWCIYCSFFGDLPPIPSPNLHQNLARSAAVASKPYKMLTRTLYTSKQILTENLHNFIHTYYSSIFLYVIIIK